MPKAQGIYILDKGVKGTFILHIQVMPGSKAMIKCANPPHNITVSHFMLGGGDIQIGDGISLGGVNSPPPDHELEGLPINFMTKDNFVEHLYK